MADPGTMAKIGTAVMDKMKEQKEQKEGEPKKTLADSARAAAQVGKDANKAIEGIKPAISWSQLLASYGLTR